MSDGYYKTVSGLYDFATNGGGQGAILIDTIEEGAVVVSFTWNLLTGFTSATNNAEVQWLHGTNDLRGGALAINPTLLAPQQGVSVNSYISDPYITPAAQSSLLLFVIDVEDLTAGKIAMTYFYTVNEPYQTV